MFQCYLCASIKAMFGLTVSERKEKKWEEKEKWREKKKTFSLLLVMRETKKKI